MSRPTIKHGDIDLTKVLGITPADGWVAAYSMGDDKPVLFWVLLQDGELVGLVAEEPRGRSLTIEIRAADKLQNFSNYLLKT